MRALALVATIVAAFLTLIALGRTPHTLAQSAPAAATTREGFDISWPGYEGRAYRERGPDGAARFELTRTGQATEWLSASEFADRYVDQKLKAEELGAIARLIRARSPAEFAWIFFGLAGQVVFAGRMIVQWIMSERRKESYVPPIFWWMSVTGSSMLLTYFTWRWDVVGMLGQGLPLLIYVRNLMLIHGGPSEDPEIANA